MFKGIVTLFFAVIVIVTGCENNEQLVPPDAQSTSIPHKLQHDTLTSAMPTTTFLFRMPMDGYVSLKLYNSQRRQAAGIIDNIYYPGGEYYSVVVDMTSFGSGVYFIELIGGGEVDDKNHISRIFYQDIVKLVLIK